jgi:formylglycine-generating enzyme required for sulfatase activity
MSKWTSTLPAANIALIVLVFTAVAFAQRPPGQEFARLKLEFVKITPGAFMMGCSDGDTACFDDEKPAHRVQITKGFEIGKYVVTQAQWEAVMGTNPSRVKGADLPVVEVSWNDAQEFLQKLNGRHDGYRYRLPTEAEWEYAARAGTTGKYYGPSLDAIAWYDENSAKQTHPVGQKQPNAWGLFDVEGNVWEWVQDWYGVDYYQQSPATDPQGPPRSDYKVLRGGTWLSDARYTRVSYRYWIDPAYRGGIVMGFRCLREAIP